MGDLRIDCIAVDISAVGIGMRGPRLATTGQFLRINFCLQTDSGVPRWFDADGVVARAVLRGDHYEFGVQFIVVEDRVAKEIHTYVTSTQRAVQMQTQATEWPNDGMPDGNHPPKRTGEFDPNGEAGDKRRTAEYGSSQRAEAVGQSGGSTRSSSSTANAASGTIDTRRATGEQRRHGTNPPSSSRTNPPIGSTTSRTTPPGTPAASSPTAASPRPAPREAPVAPLEDLVPRTDLKALYRAALSEVNGRDPKKKK